MHHFCARRCRQCRKCASSCPSHPSCFTCMHDNHGWPHGPPVVSLLFPLLRKDGLVPHPSLTASVKRKRDNHASHVHICQTTFAGNAFPAIWVPWRGRKQLSWAAFAFHKLFHQLRKFGFPGRILSKMGSQHRKLPELILNLCGVL